MRSSILAAGLAAIVIAWIVAATSAGRDQAVDRRPASAADASHTSAEAETPPDVSPRSRSPRRRAAADAPDATSDDSADTSPTTAPATPPRDPPAWRPAALEWRSGEDFGGPDRADGARVTGTIRAEDGTPVRLAILRGPFVRCRGGFGEYAGWGRAVDGRFRYDVERPPAEPGGRLFDVRAPGFVPAFVDVPAEREAEFRAGANVDDVAVVLRKAAIVTGRVLLPNGRPVAGVEIGVAGRAFDISPGVGMHLPADCDGRYRLDEIDASEDGFLVASWWDRESETNWLAPVTPLAGRTVAGEETAIDVVLERQSRATLTIEILGWREGLEISDDDHRSWFDCPREWTRTVLSGRHRFLLRDGAARSSQHEFEFDIPHGAESHRLRTEFRGE